MAYIKIRHIDLFLLEQKAKCIFTPQGHGSYLMKNEKCANIAHLLTNCRGIQFGSYPSGLLKYCNNIAISLTMNEP